MDTTNKLAVGGRYNWKGQLERLVYVGRKWSGNGYWHQFELVGRPGIVWCEVVDADLASFEETNDATPSADQATQPAEAVAASGLFAEKVRAYQTRDGLRFTLDGGLSWFNTWRAHGIPNGPIEIRFAAPAPASASVAGAGEAQKTKLLADVFAEDACDFLCKENPSKEDEATYYATKSKLHAAIDALAAHSLYYSNDQRGQTIHRLEQDLKARNEELRTLRGMVSGGLGAPTEVLAARPVADGEAMSVDAIMALADRYAEAAQHGEPARVIANHCAALRAALARQAPAPLSQVTDDRAAFKRYLDECEELAIVPDVAGAFNAGWLSRHPQPQAVTEDARDGERKSLSASVADALRPFLGEGERVIWQEPFRWHDDTGALPNHYEMFSLQNIAADFDYEVVHDCGCAGIIRAARRAQTSSGKGAE